MCSSSYSGNRRFAPVGMALLSLCLTSLPVVAQTQTSPDNSRTNKVENQGGTADQQKNTKSDVQLMAEIRRSVVHDKSLSTYGHNVKIIVAGGAVTLKGPVHSDEEKQNIGSKAAAVVGQDKVDNQLVVKQ
jgi:hyperosmotically inducible protein